LLIEGPEILDRAAAASDDQQVWLRVDRRKRADGGGDLRRGALALNRNRPQDDVRRASVLQPVEDVADHRAGRRGDYADHARKKRQPALAARVEQSFRGERLAALL